MSQKLEAACEFVWLSDNQNVPIFHPSREEENEEDVDIDEEDEEETIAEELYKKLAQGAEDLGEEEEEEKHSGRTSKPKDEQGSRSLGTHIPKICPQPLDEDITSHQSRPIWEFDGTNANDPIGCSIVNGVCVFNLRISLANPPAWGSFIQVDMSLEMYPHPRHLL